MNYKNKQYFICNSLYLQETSLGVPINNAEWINMVQPLLCWMASSPQILCSCKPNTSQLIPITWYFYTPQWITLRSSWWYMHSRLVRSRGGSNYGGWVSTGYRVWCTQSSSGIDVFCPFFQLVQYIHNFCILLFILHDDRHCQNFSHFSHFTCIHTICAAM